MDRMRLDLLPVSRVSSELLKCTIESSPMAHTDPTDEADGCATEQRLEHFLEGMTIAEKASQLGSANADKSLTTGVTSTKGLSRNISPTESVTRLALAMKGAPHMKRPNGQMRYRRATSAFGMKRVLASLLSPTRNV